MLQEIKHFEEKYIEQFNKIDYIDSFDDNELITTIESLYFQNEEQLKEHYITPDVLLTYFETIKNYKHLDWTKYYEKNVLSQHYYFTEDNIKGYVLVADYFPFKHDLGYNFIYHICEKYIISQKYYHLLWENTTINKALSKLFHTHVLTMNMLKYICGGGDISEYIKPDIENMRNASFLTLMTGYCATMEAEFIGRESRTCKTFATPRDVCDSEGWKHDSVNYYQSDIPYSIIKKMSSLEVIYANNDDEYDEYFIQDFSMFPNLVEVWLNAGYGQEQINTIPTTIKKLTLNSYSIHYTSRKRIDNLRRFVNLEELHCRNFGLPYDIFNGMESIKILDIRKSITVGVIDLPNLEELYAIGSKLTEIPQNNKIRILTTSLVNIPLTSHLTYLWSDKLTQDNITEIAKHPNITELCVKNHDTANKLDFNGLKQLKTLIIDGTKTEISKFKQLSKLVNLYMGNYDVTMQLQKFQECEFVKNVKVLCAKHSWISYSNIRHFSNIEVLVITNPRFDNSRICFDVMQTFPKLKHLYIYHTLDPINSNYDIEQLGLGDYERYKSLGLNIHFVSNILWQNVENYYINY